jgi:hypothetical protein
LGLFCLILEKIFEMQRLALLYFRIWLNYKFCIIIINWEVLMKLNLTKHVMRDLLNELKSWRTLNFMTLKHLNFILKTGEAIEGRSGPS